MNDAKQPATHVLEVLNNINFDETLEPNDPRYVDTRDARGSHLTLRRLASRFGLSLDDGRFFPPNKRHLLFFGHVGSGKSTELRHYSTQLAGADRYFVVTLDIAQVLDRNNVQYADVVMGMARVLLFELQENHVQISGNALAALEKWFQERILINDSVRELAASVHTELQAKSGLPWLVELLARFSADFRTNVTYKESLRTVIRNHFSQFAEHFNALLREAETRIAAAGLGRKVLFIVDGTDKLKSEDSRRFFLEDAEQVLALDAHVVYTAPLNLKYETGLTGKLQSDVVLPMIKLQDREGNACAAGRQAMREMLLKRADRSLFASDAEIDTLVDYSGGHPRELLRLLSYACDSAESNQIDAATVEQAIQLLAADYRRFLEPDDYPVLAEIDVDPMHGGNDQRIRRLLFGTALLEYNDGSWRRAHPVIRRLDGYKRADAGRCQ